MENQLLDDDLMEKAEGKSLSALLQGSYETHSVDYIKRGYELYKEEIGPFIGFIFLVAIAESILSAIPFAKGLAGPLMAPVVAGGFWFAMKIDKQEPREFSDFFEGTKNYANLFLVSLVPGVLVALIFLLFGGWDYFSLAFLGKNSGNNLSDLVAMFGDHGGGLSIAGILAAVISILCLFGTYLVLFERFQPLRALDISKKIIGKKFFNWLGFLFLIALFNVLGALCLLIGLLVTIPSSICAFYVAYEDVVGLNLRD